MRRRNLLFGMAAAPLASSFARQGYPSRAVRLFVPFAPGQGSDVLARALSDKLSAGWEQPVVVENRSGANGSIAAQEVSRAPPDGHTLLLTSNSPMVINPNLYRKLPYSVEKDLRPVSLLATAELALIVSPALATRTVAELIAHAQANPGKLNYGSPGSGSTSHLMMEAFKQKTGTSMVHVPYKGSSLAMADLIAGNIHLMMDALPSSLPHVSSGRVRALAVCGDRESPYLSGVPALASAGVKGLPVGGGWYGLFAPAGLQPEFVHKLHADVADVVLQTDFKARLKSLYLDEAKPMTPPQFAEFVRRETAQWEQTTRALGLFRSE